MTDTRKLLERQAAWQKGRAALTWPEKVRMAESVREWAAEQLRIRLVARAGASVSKSPETGEGQAPRGE